MIHLCIPVFEQNIANGTKRVGKTWESFGLWGWRSRRVTNAPPYATWRSLVRSYSLRRGRWSRFQRLHHPQSQTFPSFPNLFSKQMFCYVLLEHRHAQVCHNCILLEIRTLGLPVVMWELAFSALGKRPLHIRILITASCKLAPWPSKCLRAPRERYLTCQQPAPTGAG